MAAPWMRRRYRKSGDVLYHTKVGGMILTVELMDKHDPRPYGWWVWKDEDDSDKPLKAGDARTKKEAQLLALAAALVLVG